MIGYSDAFDLRYGVGILRVQEGLNDCTDAEETSEEGRRHYFYFIIIISIHIQGPRHFFRGVIL